MLVFLKHCPKHTFQKRFFLWPPSFIIIPSIMPMVEIAKSLFPTYFLLLNPRPHIPFPLGNFSWMFRRTLSSIDDSKTEVIILPSKPSFLPFWANSINSNLQLFKTESKSLFSSTSSSTLNPPRISVNLTMTMSCQIGLLNNIQIWLLFMPTYLLDQITIIIILDFTPFSMLQPQWSYS